MYIPLRLHLFHSPSVPPDPPTFPTRRSSDLQAVDPLRATDRAHDLPGREQRHRLGFALERVRAEPMTLFAARQRSEEHTSELQSQSKLVCRLLLEKKKRKKREHIAQYKESIP